MIDPNSKDYDKKGGSMIPDGDRVVAVNEIEHGESKNGTPSTTVTFKCIDPNDDANGSTLRFQNYWRTDKAVARLVGLMRAIAETTGEQLRPFALTDTEYIDKVLFSGPCQIRVETKPNTYNGETRDRTEARWANPVPTDSVESLREAYGDKLIPATSGGGGGVWDDDDGDGGFSDDEIPF